MSRIDTEFSKHERERYIEEIRRYLPAYLSKASTSRRVRPTDLGPLLNLTTTDLLAVLAVHKGLSDPVVEFVNDLSRGMRAPFTSTTQTHELSATVRGPIDWLATTKQRTQQGVSQPVFVIRPRQREFDNAANRALAHGLRRLEGLYEDAVGALAARHGDGDLSDNWHSELHNGLVATQKAKRMHWIRSVPARRLPPDAFRSLGAVRKRFYSHALAQLLRYLVVFDEDPDPQLIADAITERYFTPDQDWRLFEAVVALRIDSALESAGSSGIQRGLLVGGRGGPYAIHRFGDTTVELWYQHWPPRAHSKHLQPALKQHQISSHDTRPDIVIARTDSSKRHACLVLELKASSRPAYLAEGFGQLLGYLMDRSDHLADAPAGWLVAPRSDAFTVAETGDLQLRAVPDDEIGAAAVEFALAT